MTGLKLLAVLLEPGLLALLVQLYFGALLANALVRVLEAVLRHKLNQFVAQRS